MFTTDQIRLKLERINTNIRVDGEYTGACDPLNCQCKLCKHKWTTTWNCLSHQTGCPQCRRNQQKLTRKEVQRRLKKMNPNIKILSAVSIDGHHAWRCLCSDCGHKWKSVWIRLSQGRGCPRCFEEKHRWNTKSVKAVLKKNNPKTELLGEYEGYTLPLKCKCRVCGQTWQTSWANLRYLQHGCPKCSRNVKLTTSSVRKRLKKISPLIKLLGEYKNSSTPVKCLCLSCKTCWSPTWCSLSQGHGCPNCCSSDFKSEEEVRAIFERLTKTDWPKASPDEVPFLNGLYADGYSRKLKAIFEFDGEQHKRIVSHFHGKRNPEKKFLEQRRRDWRKNIQCWRHGIRLIRIPSKIKDKENYIRSKLSEFGWLVN